MRFADLFAGLGGFHLALKHMGHECAFACEVDHELAALYERNFGIRPAGDIRRVWSRGIPPHDILCAGFPCQPFSKAGAQQGTSCRRNGTLFHSVLRVVKHHRPKYIILENVPNLGRHNSGATWAKMSDGLMKLDYALKETVLSPHQFGVPQIRNRLFIVASSEGLDGFQWPRSDTQPLSVKAVLDSRPPDAKPLSPQVLSCLCVWQEFLGVFPREEELPSFPIWTMEFGATYPYEGTTPYAVGADGLGEYAGSHGAILREVPAQDRLRFLPSYARRQETTFPDWKVDFIRKNRQFYQQYKRVIDPWLRKLLVFPPSLQKLEWNCKGEERNIWQYLIQFRASGVRVKRPTTAPSLVAMTTTQVPIVAWEKRYMTPRECSRLQSMESLTHLPESSTKAYKALGNAVNVRLVRLIAERLLCTVGNTAGEHSLP